jgi:hypothetical protein
MLREGQENSFRKLVRVEGRSFRGPGCSECAWVFNPTSPPDGKSVDEMIRNYQLQLSEEYASHVCAWTPRVNWPGKMCLWFVFWAGGVTGLAMTHLEFLQTLLDTV